MPEGAPFDVLIVGAGPAGMSAAATASRSGASVALVDENPEAGGQIYRASQGMPSPAVGQAYAGWMREHVTVFSGATIVDASTAGVVLATTPEGVRELRYKKLILSVGAREMFVPFPGWTLPNVMGVGGLQAMVKGGLDVNGKRIVVAGAGPLLMAVADYLNKHGACVVVIAEQAATSTLAHFLLTLGRYPSKIKQGADLLRSVGRLLKHGAWVEKANGKDKLEEVILNKSSQPIPCDYLACSFGFVPNLELPNIIGCEIAGGYVRVDELQRTTVADVFCAGEPTGIGGVELSEVEGRIAGFAATGQAAEAGALFAERSHWQHFAGALERTFALRDELKSLAQSDTIVCRCEDVVRSQLDGWSCGREAKLHTRCGMGPCQGRVCGPATRFLYGWEAGSVRPPLIPIPLSGLDKPIEAPANHTN